MSTDDSKRAYRKDLLLASATVVIGLAIFGVFVVQLKGAHPNSQMAQATQPLQSTPGAETKPSGPSTTDVRPSEVSPEPARPDADAQKAGAAPALPPAPAEKTAAPIKER